MSEPKHMAIDFEQELESPEPQGKSINWQVRVRNKSWWLTMVPALFVLISCIGRLWGAEWDFANLQVNIIAVVEAVFAFLAVLGVNIDPTTNLFADGPIGITYTRPAPNVHEVEDVEAVAE